MSKRSYTEEQINWALEELRVTLGLSSVSSVQRHTDALKEKGYLENTRGLALPDSSDKVQIPLVGNVACGVPFLATENVEAYIQFDSSKISGTPDDYFFLRAVGDSMNKTNISGKTIDDGDYVLIKKQSVANPGDRIVALIGDEATIKKMVPTDGASRASSNSNTQREAEKDAKKFSGNSGGGEVRIKGLDNKWRDSDTVAPAKDPNPPKDKKH